MWGGLSTYSRGIPKPHLQWMIPTLNFTPDFTLLLFPTILWMDFRKPSYLVPSIHQLHQQMSLSLFLPIFPHHFFSSQAILFPLETFNAIFITAHSLHPFQFFRSFPHCSLIKVCMLKANKNVINLVRFF